MSALARRWVSCYNKRNIIERNGEQHRMEGLSNIATVKAVMAKHHMDFSKSLGQNFLVNPAVCPRIAKEGVPGPEYGVIEVGTGIGVLTNELAKCAKKVVGVEIDSRLLPILEETLSDHDNIKIVHADVMKTDLHALIEEEFPGMPVCVCANLPYYITSPVLMKLLEERLPIDCITVMVQKEAADRLCALPGKRECGAVSFAVRYYSEPEVLFPVSHGSFLPPPKVDSAVIRLNVRAQDTVRRELEPFFFSLVRAAFSQRRKTLANPVSGQLGFSKQQVREALETAGLKPTARAEELSFEQFTGLAEALWALRHA